MTDDDVDASKGAARLLMEWTGEAVTAANAKEMATDILALVAEVRRLRAENELLRAPCADHLARWTATPMLTLPFEPASAVTFDAGYDSRLANAVYPDSRRLRYPARLGGALICRFYCPACERQYDSRDRFPPCPDCGREMAEVTEG